MPIAIPIAMAAAAAASAVVKKKAADKAAKAQKKGLETQAALLKKNDPVSLNKAAIMADEERAKRRLDLQKEIDPELAAIREQSKKTMQKFAETSPEERASGQLARTLYEEVKAPDQKTEQIKDQLLSAAQQELSAGATLPPEFQAELVRSGLNTGSQAGLAIDKNVIGGGVARMLGAGGIQLQKERQQQAMALTQQAENLKRSRVDILSSVFPKLRDLETSNLNEARQSFGLAEAALPESGFGGTELVNLKLGMMKNQMQLAQSKANLKAQQAQAKGQFVGELIGAGASAVGGVAGGFMGGGGAATGSGFGGVVNNPMGGQKVDIGYFGSRTPAQMSAFQGLQSVYE